MVKLLKKMETQILKWKGAEQWQESYYRGRLRRVSGLIDLEVQA